MIAGMIECGTRSSFTAPMDNELVDGGVRYRLSGSSLAGATLRRLQMIVVIVWLLDMECLDNGAVLQSALLRASSLRRVVGRQ